VLSAGAVLVPHPDKADKGGEDACFVLRDQGAFGVMDGVGGWAEEGVDPAAYSNTFAEKSAAAVLLGTRDPRAIIADAHENTRLVGRGLHSLTSELNLRTFGTRRSR
jgi:protein phosphatase PTC7